MEPHQISIDEYLASQEPDDSDDPCDHCKRPWCYGCEYADD